MKLGCQARSFGKGIQLAYHNHWWESEQEGLVKLAAYTDPSYVGFAFDTGHHIRAGKDAIALVKELSDRLSIIHLSDHSEDAKGHAFRPQLGTGVLDLSALRNAIEGFTGWLVLEEENNAPSPKTQVAECIEVMRQQFIRGQ